MAVDAHIQKLRKVLVEGLQLSHVAPEDIDPDEPLFGGRLGLDSVDALEFVMEIERNFGALPDSRRVSHLVHPVRGAESLREIANYYGLEVDRLAKYNNLGANSGLKSGQEIKIPASKTLLVALAGKSLGASKGGAVGGQVTHKVKKGETLARIAKKYGSSTSQIAQWNKLGKKSALRAGQNLKIYRKGAAKAAPASQRPFYAAGLSDQQWAPPVQYAQAEESSTSAEPDSRDSLSGVAHLIFIEEANTDDIGVEAVEDGEDEGDANTLTTSWDNGEDSDAPEGGMTIMQVAAAADNEEQAASPAEFPGFVKTGEDDAPVASETPAPTALPDQPAAARAASPKTNIHVVKSGESLTTIAAKYKVSVASLKKWNNLTRDTIQAKQKLRVQPGLAVSPAPTVARSSVEPFLWHKIRSGESLWVLAKKYRVTVADIKKWNKLSGNDVRANQKLKIFASGTTS